MGHVIEICSSRPYFRVVDLFPADVYLVASLLRQIKVSKHTLGKACFRGVDLFPAEVNLVASLLRQIRAKSAPDSWSLANIRMLYYVFRSAGQVLHPCRGARVAQRLITCVAMPPQTDSCFETYASYDVCFRGWI